MVIVGYTTTTRVASVALVKKAEDRDLCLCREPDLEKDREGLIFRNREGEGRWALEVMIAQVLL